MKGSEKRVLLLLGMWVLGWTVWGRWPTALAPDPTDAQLFAYIGERWAAGDIPYRDIWDNKPPGIFLINALVLALFPKSFTALACVEGLFIVGALAAVHGLMGAVKAPPAVRVLATATAAVAVNLPFYNERGNLTEMYLLWPAVAGMACLVRSSPQFRGQGMFFAGLLAGAASFFKPTGLAVLLAQGAFLLGLAAVFRRITFRRLVTALLLMAAGLATAWIPFVVYFAHYGVVTELLDASFVYVLRYGAASQTGSRWLLPFKTMASLEFITGLVACAALGLGLYAGRCREREGAGGEAGSGPPAGLCLLWPLVFWWVLFDGAAAAAGGRNYPHYFLPLTVSLSVAAAWTAWFVHAALPPGPSFQLVRRAFYAVVLAPLLFAQLAAVPAVHHGFKHRGSGPWVGVTRYLNGVRQPGDTLFTWDYLPAVFYATGMRSPSRHADAHSLADFRESHRRFGERILRDLEGAPPSFIVDGTADAAGQRATDGVYRRFCEFLESRYRWVHSVGAMRIYERLTVPTGGISPGAARGAP
jgi:hypothetical protein